jgi:hypothetical protein
MENIQIINEPTSVPKRNNDDREQNERATSPNASLEDSVALVMLSRQQHAYDRLCELIPPAVPNEIALHPQWCNINSAFIGAMHWAYRLGWSNGLALLDAWSAIGIELVRRPSVEELRKLFELFGRLNAEVWPREQTFEPESPDNREWRRLGEAMHWLHEWLKFENLLAGGEPWCDPEFTAIFVEGIERAKAGEPIAVEVMRTKWDIEF